MANATEPVTSGNKKVFQSQISESQLDLMTAAVRVMQQAVLRDQFAMHALQGYLASTATDFEPTEVASKIASDCYELADAMMAAREKPCMQCNPSAGYTCEAHGLSVVDGGAA